jgi:hypothetical protein
MSSSHESGSWVDEWWPLLVIAFGLIFVTLLVSFHPVIWNRLADEAGRYLSVLHPTLRDETAQDGAPEHWDPGIADRRVGGVMAVAVGYLPVYRAYLFGWGCVLAMTPARACMR